MKSLPLDTVLRSGPPITRSNHFGAVLDSDLRGTSNPPRSALFLQRLAHGFLIVALDRPDVLLSGDLALRRAVQPAYGFDHLPTEDEMVQVAERWRPYRSLAVSYLFTSAFEKGT